MLGDGTEALTDSDDAEIFDDEEAVKEEKDDEALQKSVGKVEDEEMKDIMLKSEKGKENAKIASTTPARNAPPTDESSKEVASK